LSCLQAKFNATKAEEAKGKVADAIKKAVDVTKQGNGKVCNLAAAQSPS
jgi:hypothetical protein